MGREKVYILIPPNTNDRLAYATDVLDKILAMNKQIPDISMVTLKEMFTDIKEGKVETLEALCKKHYINYTDFSDKIDKDFPIRWSHYLELKDKKLHISTVLLF